eukprot:TRINITY_DN2827_c0_g1_i1.p1 TRINITY_DN2827_c0_g1~~TRINITY_DN2827_c0_g1_i1.p1  ORF type:complete len:553 (-),score=146.98 TRINITY_DN2827_c0_g1_i1:185-1843(-)
MDGGDSKPQDIEEKRQFEAELRMSSAGLPRTFEGALVALDALITRTPGKGADLLFNRSLDSIKDSVKRLALPLSKVKWIHVAGTKGKGSTCALCESMFRRMGLKTGLYTSPHLLTVRERIRINGEALPEEEFSKSFWYCWDRLMETHSEESEFPMLPTFFRFLTLVGFHSMIEQNVDVGILEVGMGGRFDATNVIEKPVVCGVSSLGFDHMHVLGNTLGEIGYEKAGIFKEGVRAVSSPQKPEGMASLVKRANELNIPLFLTPPIESIIGLDGEKPRVGLRGEHQVENARLAVALVDTFLEAERDGTSYDPWKGLSPGPIGLLPLEFSKDKPVILSKGAVDGLENVQWPGRGQVEEVYHSSHQKHPIFYYLDGAHTPESAEVATRWFMEESKNRASQIKPTDSDEEIPPQPRRYVVFYCSGERNAKNILKFLGTSHAGDIKSLVAVPISAPKEHLLSDRVLLERLRSIGIVENPSDCLVEESDAQEKFPVQWGHAEVWKELSGGVGQIAESMGAAMSFFQSESVKSDTPIHVFILGSLYLVSDALRQLNKSG